MADSSGLAITILDVSGMVCAGCAARIRAALLAWPGVLSVDVDLIRQTARVAFLHDRVLYRDLVEAISGAGGNERNHLEASVIA